MRNSTYNSCLPSPQAGDLNAEEKLPLCCDHMPGAWRPLEIATRYANMRRTAGKSTRTALNRAQDEQAWGVIGQEYK
jgi:hypothetical protein